MTNVLGAGNYEGDLCYWDTTTSSWILLSANTTTTRKFLRETGTGSAGQAPVWDTLVAGDIPALQYPWGAFTPVSAKLSSAASSLDLSSIPAADFYLFIIYVAGFSSADRCIIKFNGDTGSNYAISRFLIDANNSNGSAAQFSTTSLAGPWAPDITNETGQEFTQGYVRNPASSYKIGFSNCTVDAGTGNPPDVCQVWFKWQNTSAQINEITIYTLGGHNFNSGTELMVWGQNLL